MTRFVHRIAPRDIEHGGSASAEIKRELRAAGVSAYDARRAGIVAFEGEMNLMVHSTRGGTIEVDLRPGVIEVVVEDDGPGISDVDLALTPGFSTAPDWATELGFGAGMGLPNMQRNSDGFEIHSQPGRGTRVRCRIEREPHPASPETPPSSTSGADVEKAACEREPWEPDWAQDLGVGGAHGQTPETKEGA
ncbi:MAG: ATP-binding protein [Candidatus Bipolaricaulota bacterium]